MLINYVDEELRKFLNSLAKSVTRCEVAATAVDSLILFVRQLSGPNDLELYPELI